MIFFKGYANVCIGLQDLGLLNPEEKSITGQPISWVSMYCL